MAFDKNFIWGAATASYQIEGAANEDGKSLNIWDTFCEIPGKVYNGHSGAVGCDHYHRVDEDVALMKEIGIKAYRFSLSWSRIIPDGIGEVNAAGVAFYNHLINKLLENGITPYITLYHWDLPYCLYLRGGWMNPEISDRYANYAKVVIEAFSDRVKSFITFNEPEVFVDCGYRQGFHAPGYKLGKRDMMVICHNVLTAHGKAVANMRKYAKQPLEIGFVSATMPPIPVNKTEKEIEAARNSYFVNDEYAFPVQNGIWEDTICFGKYPDDIDTSLLPEGYEKDLPIISTPIDFIGLNIYRGQNITADENGNRVNKEPALNQPTTAMDWEITPEALYWGPKFFHERYGLPIYITENGISVRCEPSPDGKVYDIPRIDYMRDYIGCLKKASEDGVEVKGYFAWSLLDNFEWACGYKERFGLIHVNYATGERTLKESAKWYSELIKKNGN
ncbi:MAG: beta-glucosidase [Ruminococcaceae bacterium]|nr:beta-glucosidase [Oscillospiraceae bacterium]